MEYSGRFFFSIFAGRYGQSSVRQRNILATTVTQLVASFSEPSSASKSRSILLGIINNNLIIAWDSK